MRVDQLNTVIRGLVRDILSLPANYMRPANQNAPVGDTGFGTVHIVACVGQQWAGSKFLNEPLPSMNVEETVTMMYSLSVSVQFFKAGAYTLAQRLGILLQSSYAQQQMANKDIGFVNAGAAKNLTGLIDTYFEERGQIDLTFYVLAREVLSLATFGHFPISTRQDDPDSTIISTIVDEPA